MKDDSCEDPRSSTVRQGQADNGNAIPLAAEWLEADGLGGFASGTVDGIRTRRYHALLLSAAWSWSTALRQGSRLIPAPPP
jgi:hypothetical protein